MSQHRAITKVNFGDLHKYFPPIPVLIIHGTVDQIVPLNEGQFILKKIPWARMVQIGDKPGQIPSGKFGHHWWEYFNVKIWEDAIEKFVTEGGQGPRARL